MEKDKFHYRKDAAFINRGQEMKFLHDYIDIRPESILFLHGPKSSGKTTLLYKFLDLRETFTNVYDDFLKTFFRVETQGEKKETLTSNINIGFFKIDAAMEKKILEKRADPFKVI